MEPRENDIDQINYNYYINEWEKEFVPRVSG